MSTVVRKRTVRKRATAVTTKRTRGSSSKEQEVTKLLNKASDLMQENLANTIELRGVESRIAALMEDLGETEHDNGIARAFYKTPRTTSTTEYDKEALFEIMEEDEFLSSVKVIGTNVKKFLTGKQLEEVSTVTKGEPKPAKFTVELMTGK
jgi:acyl-CoA reductase-like NAD-dependent aldehyde dehydrogenase